MAYIVDLESHSDDRGVLTVVEKVLPFEIRRVYFIDHPKGVRGLHSHKKTIQALVVVRGSLKLNVKSHLQDTTFLLDDQKQCLILEPIDWHFMSEFDDDCIILVMASEYYDPNDYVRLEDDKRL